MNTSIIKSLVEHIGGDSNTISDGTVLSDGFISVSNKYLGYDSKYLIPFSFIHFKNTSNEMKKLMFVDNNVSSTYFGDVSQGEGSIPDSSDGFRAVDVNGNVYEFLKGITTSIPDSYYACNLSNSSGYAPNSDQTEAKVIIKNIESDFFTPDEIVMASFAAYLKFLG